jgi:hypothetical protein
MTSILSSIYGHFGKALMLGALLPATVFMLLWSVFIEPIVPAVQTLLQPLGMFSEEWPVLAAIFIIIILVGLLYSLNIAIIRFYEGYPWQGSYLGQWRIAFYRRKFQEIKAAQNGIRTLLRVMLRTDPEYSGILRNWSASGDAFKKTYPNKELLILPTRLGNVIRSFERYPDEQYGMESILFWTRLVSVIDKDYANIITDAKTSLDFMLNSSVLSAILAFAALILGLVFPQYTLASPAMLAAWLAKIMAFLFLAYIFYLGAVPRASAWGETVKGAFDLYRWDLLKQLGYQQEPKTPRTERALWKNLSIQMIYGDHPLKGPYIDYAPPVPPATPFAASEGLALSLSRGAAQPENPHSLQVILQVSNPDEEKIASQVVVTDAIPDGYDYLWGSASSPDCKVSVEGTNPYRFSIGNLKPRQTVTLSYTFLRRVTE